MQDKIIPPRKSNSAGFNQVAVDLRKGNLYPNIWKIPGFFNQCPISAGCNRISVYISYFGQMNFKGPIIVLLCISCNSHPAPVVKAPAAESTFHVQDSVAKATAMPVNTTPPLEEMPVREIPVQNMPAATQVFTTDLNNDQIPDTIAIASTTGDTVTFDMVSVAIAGFGKQAFRTSNPWTMEDDWWLDSNKNAIPTDKLFLKKGKLQSVLLLFGNLDGAGDRDDFTIVNIENNTAKLVLDQVERHIRIETPVSLDDLDGDGRLDFVYTQIIEYSEVLDSLGGGIGPYSPYFVYTVNNNCVLNKPLTIRYNQEHYLFAGFEYNDGIRVFYPNDKSKPRLWKHKL